MQLSIEINDAGKLTGRNRSENRKNGSRSKGRSRNSYDKGSAVDGKFKPIDDMDRAMEIWLNLQDSIHRLIDKIISFNSSYDREDYMQEAFLACVKAVGKYSRMRNAKINSTYSKEFIDMTSDLRKNRKLVWMIEGLNGEGIRVSTCKNEPKMKPEVFAYWYIEKILFRVASGSNEVVFNIYDEHGEYERTVGNAEFRKIKKGLEKEGRTVKSDNIFRDISFFNDEEEENGTSHEFIDANFIGFSSEVKEMLQEDMNRFYKGSKKTAIMSTVDLSIKNINEKELMELIEKGKVDLAILKSRGMATIENLNFLFLLDKITITELSTYRSLNRTTVYRQIMKDFGATIARTKDVILTCKTITVSPKTEV